MKKNYFFTLFAALMLFVAMPASAEVSSMADLFGKYKFTATITPTEAGQEYTDFWQDDCEVIITKGEGGAAGTVKGLLGKGADQTVANFDAANTKFEVVNPNPNYGLLSTNPYIGVADMSLDNLQLYTMEYHYNAETKEITIPDFSICEFSWPGGVMTGNVLAEVTNVKMELLEAEKIDIPEIEGEWSFKPYNMNYVRNDTTFVYEFKVNLVAKDETKELYDATFKFEGFEDFTLEATFNGVNLVIPFSNQYLDAEKKIRLGVKATTQEMTLIKEGQLSFTYSSSTLMWQGDYIVIRQDVITTEEVDGVMVEKESALTLQQITYGWLEREDPNAYDWSGKYDIKVKNLDNYTDVEFPNEFKMVVKKAGGTYTVKEFLGYETSFELTPSEDGKSAKIDLAGYYGFVWLTSLGEVDGDYAYYILTDLNGKSTSLNISLNEDGSLSIDDFSVSYKLWMAGTSEVVADMARVSIAKSVFDWAGEYTLSATVVAEDENAVYPAEFDVVVKLYNDGKYRIEKFMDTNVYNLNQGFQTVEIAEDGNSATLALDAYYGYYFVAGGYPDYVTLNDKDGKSTSLSVVLGDDEVLTMDDFTIYAFNWSTNTSNKLATYSNVTLTKKAVDAAIDEIIVENKVVEGIFDLLGRKLDTITAPGIYIVNGKKMLVK